MHEESTRSAAAHAAAAAGTAAEATGGREGTETAPQVPAAGCGCVCVFVLQEPCTQKEETCILPLKNNDHYCCKLLRGLEVRLA